MDLPARTWTHTEVAHFTEEECIDRDVFSGMGVRLIVRLDAADAVRAAHDGRRITRRRRRTDGRLRLSFSTTPPPPPYPDKIRNGADGERTTPRRAIRDARRRARAPRALLEPARELVVA